MLNAVTGGKNTLWQLEIVKRHAGYLSMAAVPQQTLCKHYFRLILIMIHYVNITFPVRRFSLKSLNPSIHPSTYYLIYPSNNLIMYPSKHPSIHPPIYSNHHPTIYPSIDH